MDRNAELARITAWYEDFFGTPEVCNDVVAYAVAHLGFEGRKGEVNGVWHCWLVEDGRVIDPTAHQFDTPPAAYPPGEVFEVKGEVERIL
jgi:hypothetical protein